MYNFIYLDSSLPMSSHQIWICSFLRLWEHWYITLLYTGKITSKCTYYPMVCLAKERGMAVSSSEHEPLLVVLQALWCEQLVL